MSRRLRDRSRAAIGSVIVLAGTSPDHTLVSADWRGSQVTPSAVPQRALHDAGRALGIPVILSVGAPPRLLTAGDDERVAGLTLDPPIIDCETSGTAIGTVTLNAPAPAGGVVVTLGSSNVELAATLPSITIPAGATQGALAVTTNASYRRFSGLALSVTISATHAATVSATMGLRRRRGLRFDRGQRAARKVCKRNRLVAVTGHGRARSWSVASPAVADSMRGAVLAPEWPESRPCLRR